MEAENKKKRTLVVLHVTPEFHKAFKKLAIDEGKTVGELTVKALISAYRKQLEKLDASLFVGKGG